MVDLSGAEDVRWLIQNVLLLFVSLGFVVSVHYGVRP